MSFRVVPYSETWPHDFAATRGALLVAFDDPSVVVEHIGSTAVPGLCAKPVIDVLVGAPALAGIEAAIPRLQAAGYRYVSQYEVELAERRYFVQAEAERPRVHVHAVVRGAAIWTQHLAFRDALRADAALRDAYAALKLELARTHASDKAAYTAAKAPFIRQVLSTVGRSSSRRA